MPATPATTSPPPERSPGLASLTIGSGIVGPTGVGIGFSGTGYSSRLGECELTETAEEVELIVGDGPTRPDTSDPDPVQPPNIATKPPEDEQQKVTVAPLPSPSDGPVRLQTPDAQIAEKPTASDEDPGPTQSPPKSPAEAPPQIASKPPTKPDDQPVATKPADRDTPQTPPVVTTAPEPKVFVKVNITLTGTRGTQETTSLAGASIRLGSPHRPDVPNFETQRTAELENNDGASEGEGPAQLVTNPEGEGVIPLTPAMARDLGLSPGQEARVEVSVERRDMAIVRRPTPPGSSPTQRGGRLKDTVPLLRFASLGSGATASDVCLARDPMQACVQMAQGAFVSGDDGPMCIPCLKGIIEDEALQDGSSVEGKLIVIGDTEFVQVRGTGFAPDVFFRWLSRVDTVINPCRKPQPGPPVGMTAAKPCGQSAPGSDATASSLPQATIRFNDMRSAARWSPMP